MSEDGRKNERNPGIGVLVLQYIVIGAVVVNAFAGPEDTFHEEDVVEQGGHERIAHSTKKCIRAEGKLWVLGIIDW